MGYIVRMPKLGVEMQTGVLLEWHVDSGDDVAEADLLAEIESEKTTAEVTARENGAVQHLLLEPGEEVEPGTPMAIIGDDDEAGDLLAEVESDVDSVDGQAAEAEESTPAETDDSAGNAPDSGDSPTEAAAERGSVRATPKARKLAEDADVSVASLSGTGPKGAVTEADVERALTGSAQPSAASDVELAAGDANPSGTERTGGTGAEQLVTPRARKRASELGVELDQVAGTGPHGSIRAADVETAARRPEAGGSDTASGATSTDVAGRTVVEERPLSGMRSTISRRLSESWEAPHVTVDRRIDAEAALDVADSDDAISITDVLMVAVSETLSDHPAFNATFEAETHRIYDEHNIGFAVDVDAGLLTPVLMGVDEMSVTELGHRRAALTERVLDQRHEPADLRGGTFTITNLGAFGVDSFTPIINPPQVAILGVNRIREEPKRTDRGIEFRRTMGFSLSFDHRVVDGADAARFLDTLADHLANAAELVE